MQALEHGAATFEGERDVPQTIVADSFFHAAARLSGHEKRILGFVSKFLSNPANPGASLERVTRAGSKNVWSARISRELRAILHRDGSVWALLHCGHHDDAYQWARRRTIGRHEVTGQLQIVKTVEVEREIERIRTSTEPNEDAPPLFADHGDPYLLSVGVPKIWLPVIRKLRSEDQLLEIHEKLPSCAGDNLLDIADGKLVTPPKPLAGHRPVTDAPGMQSRFFFVSDDVQGLRAALQAPLERWIAFLHPDQRSMVEREFSGPAKVSGSAGTGKTVVAMHRARTLARRGERVLLTTFTTTLKQNLEQGLRMLCSDEELRAIDVRTVDSAALSVAKRGGSRVYPNEKAVATCLEECRERMAPLMPAKFVEAEWNRVIQMQGIETWDAYRTARRIGRGKRMPVAERRQLWPVFEATLRMTAEKRVCTWSGMSTIASRLLREGKVSSPCTAVVVDEVQDLTTSKLRFLHALCAAAPENFMICGDAGQRIYPGGFSLRALGIEVRGRSTVLRVNYRTSRQIQKWADRVRPAAVDDMEGGRESRIRARSVFRGPEPRGLGARSWDEEAQAALGVIMEWRAAGYEDSEIAVFARSVRRLGRLKQALDGAAIAWDNLAKARRRKAVQMGTMHRAKGLEFKVVLVLGCDEHSLPSYQARKIEDESEQQNEIDLERNLLYAAMTRARDELVLTWAGPPSPFLAEIAEIAAAPNAD